MSHADAAHVTPADRIIGALAFASGSADGFAFLKFHDLFTSAMTGNTALFAVALGQGHLLAASRSMTALLGFGLGCVSGTLVDDRYRNGAGGVRALLAAEFAGLAIVALLWTALHHPPNAVAIYGLIAIAAWSMGVQSIAARAIDLPGIPTVVFTTTLSIIMMSLTRRLRRPGRAEPVKPIMIRQIGAFSIYIFGAALSGLLAVTWPAAIALPAPIAVGFALLAGW